MQDEKDQNTFEQLSQIDNWQLQTEESQPLSDGYYEEEPARIGGWLAFFLFVGMMGGSVISLAIMLSSFSVAEAGGSLLLALTDPVLAVLMFALACYTLYAFFKRKPDAVFLAKTYVVAVFLSGIMLLIVSVITHDATNTRELIRPLVWGTIWFIFLCVSTRVEAVIPSETRHTSKTDRWIVGLLIGLPALLFVLGIVQLKVVASSQEKQKMEFLSTVVLADGEYTDGRVVFTCPDGMECTKQEEDGETYYVLESANQFASLVSEFNSDDSQGCADSYWKQTENEDFKYWYYYNEIDEVRIINGNKAFVKIGRYKHGHGWTERYVFRRFALIFHKASGKACLVSGYDPDEGDYFDDLLRSIRFE